jgi:hypothetical protein
MDWVLQSADYLSLILREMTPESDALLVCRAWRESIMSRKANPTTEITEYEDDMMVKWKLSMQDLNRIKSRRCQNIVTRATIR